MKTYSWGRTNYVSPTFHEHFNPSLSNNLVCGSRMSYGDVCLNSSNLTTNLQNNKIINFNIDTSIIHVESGITIKDLHAFSMKKLFFLHVTPGTKHVTIAGAIANNVHGKEHHLFGAFGNYIVEFELVNSTGTHLCSRESNTDLFYETIGGLGLTGYIKTAKLKLKKVKGNQIVRKTIKFNKVTELKELFDNSLNCTYTVAWFDSFSFKGNNLKGLFYSGEFIHKSKAIKNHRNNLLQYLPSLFLNKLTIRLFNSVNFFKIFKKVSTDIISFDSFFYPLDKVKNWNKIYGKKGFFQFQCVIPFDNFDLCFPLLMSEANKMGSFLSVIKIMKDESEKFSKLSFPSRGISIALDFKNTKNSKHLISKMNEIVADHSGKVYFAKDSVLTGKQVAKMYDLSSFLQYRDQNLNSLLFERITID